MAHNSLYPGSIRIDYQTAFGLHTQTLPTCKVALDGGVWKFIETDLSVVGVVSTMVAAWVAAFKQFFPATTTFLGWQAFNYATPTAAPIPMTSGTLGVVGTHSNPAGTQSHAVQATYTWRTSQFGIFKVVGLDYATGSFEKITNVAHANVAPLDTIVTNAATCFRGRDGGKALTFLQLAFTLNEKLRKSYRMN